MSEVSSLKRKAGRGAVWQLLGGGWQTVVRLCASFFLARALTPDDFGVFGMAIIVSELLNAIGAMGFGTGIIAKKNVSKRDLDTFFGFCLRLEYQCFLSHILLHQV